MEKTIGTIAMTIEKKLLKYEIYIASKDTTDTSNFEIFPTLE